VTEPNNPYGVPEQPEGQQPPGAYPPPPPLQPNEYGQPPAYGQPRKTNTLAIVALVAAFFCSPAGIIMGLISKNQIKQRGEGGDGLATAAIVVGVLLLLFNIYYFTSMG